MVTTRTPGTLTFRGRVILGPNRAVHYVVGTGLLSLLFLIEFVSSAFGHMHKVCSRTFCQTLTGSGAQFLNWWAGIAFVAVFVMFLHDMYLWRVAVRMTDGESIAS